MARKLARHFGHIDNLMKASREELLAVDEVGDKVASSIIEYFDDTANLEMIEKLKQAGLSFETEASGPAEGGVLKGQSFVVSGVFQKYSRDELKSLITQHGGDIKGSISSKTNYLVAGENMGPEKQKKAQSLHVPIISEEELEKIIRQ